MFEVLKHIYYNELKRKH